MKKLILTIAIALLLMPVVVAETTGGADWNNDLKWGNQCRDYLGGHTHEYEKQQGYSKKAEAGLGIDFLYFVNKKQRIDNKVVKTITPDAIEWTNSYDLNERRGDGYKTYLRAKYYINQRVDE